MLRSTAVLTDEGVDLRERKNKSAEINCRTHGWRCRLKRERQNAEDQLQLVVSRVDVYTLERERKKCSDQLQYSRVEV